MERGEGESKNDLLITWTTIDNLPLLAGIEQEIKGYIIEKAKDLGLKVLAIDFFGGNLVSILLENPEKTPKNDQKTPENEVKTPENDRNLPKFDQKTPKNHIKIGKIVSFLKGFSSYMVRNRHILLKKYPNFWENGYNLSEITPKNMEKERNFSGF